MAKTGAKGKNSQTKSATIDLFGKSKKKATGDAKPKKQTLWQVDGQANENAEELARNIDTIVEQAQVISAATNKAKMAKVAVANYAYDKFVAHVVDTGTSPETPMNLINSRGNKVTYVVQDRSTSQGRLNEHQYEDLVELLGEDKVEEVVYTKDTYSFNPEILSKPGVQKVINTYLTKAVEKLVNDETLLPDEASELLNHEGGTWLRPGIIVRLREICGKDIGRVKSFLSIVAGACVRYAKA